MKNFNRLEQFADSVIALCNALYGCDEIDVNIDMDIDNGGISISLELTPVADDDDDDREVTEEELDEACAEYYYCSECPYEDYCNGEDEDDE